jgi:hypothetical protein
MKPLVILLNVALIIFAAIIFWEIGVADSSVSVERLGDILFVLLMLLTPILNLIYIFLWSGESWPGRYFKRKAMEETRKNEKISGKE